MKVVPVNLGCCPGEPRCLLCPPATPPAPETVAALVALAEGPCEVRFFGGAPPDDTLIEAIGGAPFLARVRPDLLTRADAARLVARGCVGIELDVLTFDDAALREARRPYRRARVEEMSRGLRALGLRVGGTLAPGLPRTSAETCLHDAAIAADLWSFARLHPVLVLARSALRELHETGRYTPLELGEAVTVCRHMLDLLEARGVEVIRIGLQPGPDGFGRATAGPRHASLRELVEARRAYDLLRARLQQVPRGAAVVVRCSPRDVSRARGPYNQHVRALRADLGLRSLDVVADQDLSRGQYHVEILPVPLPLETV